MTNQLDAAAIEQLVDEIWNIEINKLLIWYTLPRPELRVLNYKYGQQLVEILNTSSSFFIPFDEDPYQEFNTTLLISSKHIYGQVIFATIGNNLEIPLCGLGKRLVKTPDSLDLTAAINKTAELLRTYSLLPNLTT